MRMLSEDVAAAGQISVADVPHIAKAGFKSIVCNRPDGEGFGQTPYAEIEKAAKAAGLEIRYQPVHSRGLSAHDAEHLKTLLAELPRPLLLYCASGARSSILYGMTQQLQGQPRSFGFFR